MADYIYKSADEVIAVSQTYVDRVMRVNRKCKEGHSVFLGTELETFDRNARKETVLQKKLNEIWLAYCGTLGTSYDIKCVIDALAYLNHPDIKFIVMGDGPLREEFERYADQKGVNSFFLGRLQYDEMCAILSDCNITTNPIIGSSIASIINKHADYAASGLPVINTQDSAEYKSLIEAYNMGFSVAPGDYIAFAEKLKLLVEDTHLRKKMGENAHKCAKVKFDRNGTYGEIETVVLSGENTEERSGGVSNSMIPDQ
jgi:glycosyltransferase involved in cell wall biosynthesis